MGLQDQCTLCHRPIFWTITIGNRRWPLDATPDPAGNVILIDVDGKRRAKILTGPEMPAQQEAYRAHECARTRPGPRCRGCEGPMNRELAELEHWTHHPCCDPTYQRLMAEKRLAAERRAA